MVGLDSKVRGTDQCKSKCVGLPRTAVRGMTRARIVRARSDVRSGPQELGVDMHSISGIPASLNPLPCGETGPSVSCPPKRPPIGIIQTKNNLNTNTIVSR